MLNKLKYPALSAKIKGMYAKHFNKTDIEELLRQNNLKDAIYILKTKFPSLENINENMHRREIEQELNNLFIVDILKISKYLNKKEKEILMQFISKYEINCIKNVFRNLTANTNDSSNLKNIDNWTNSIFTSIDGINEINDETDFLKIIKSKEYYNIFKEYVKVIENAPLEEIEVKLDKYYFAKVYELSKKINKDFQNIIGTEIDLLNITWIIRAKQYFKYSDKEINDIIIPIRYRLNKETLIDIIKANDFEEIKNILKYTIYKNIFKNLETIEHEKNKYLYVIYQKLFKMNLFNICTVFCNINLVDIEIKNIINIIEGIRYKVDKSEIYKRIII